MHRKVGIILSVGSATHVSMSPTSPFEQKDHWNRITYTSSRYAQYEQNAQLQMPPWTMARGVVEVRQHVLQASHAAAAALDRGRRRIELRATQADPGAASSEASRARHSVERPVPDDRRRLEGRDEDAFRGNRGVQICPSRSIPAEGNPRRGHEGVEIPGRVNNMHWSC